MLVLFDVDGTLFLTHDPLFGQALVWAIEQVYGLRRHAAALDESDHAGQSTLKLVRELSGRDERLAECCERTSDRYVELLSGADTSEWEAPTNARETLEETKSRASVALLTGNPEPVARARMERLGLGAVFPQGQGAFGCERVHRVDLIALARARANNEPADETWFVGNSPTEVESARAAGIHCVAVASDEFSRADLDDADAVVDRFSEVPRSLF